MFKFLICRCKKCNNCNNQGLPWASIHVAACTPKGATCNQLRWLPAVIMAMAEVQKSLEKLAQGSGVAARDGLIGLLNAIQRSSLSPELASALPVVEAMEQHPGNSAVQRWGAATLEELFRRSFVHSDVACRAVSALVSGARANLEAIEVQRWCFSALACSLTMCEEDASDSNVLAKHMLEQDAMTVVASAIQLHGQSPSLLDSAASLVSCMVMEGGDTAADEAFRTGCLHSILSTLTATLETAEGEGGNSLTADASLQQACLRALWAICEANGELGATEIAADDGFESIINILAQEKGKGNCGQVHTMEADMEVLEVHKWCASLLQSLLAQGGDLVAESALLSRAAEALVASIALFGTHVEVVERCAAALATLAAYGPDAAISVLEAGGRCSSEHTAISFTWRFLTINSLVYL